MKKKKGRKKKTKIRPRNFLVPLVRMKRSMRIEDKRYKLLEKIIEEENNT